MKSDYIAEEDDFDIDFDENDEEVAYVVKKDDFDENDKTTLIYHMSKNDM